MGSVTEWGPLVLRAPTHVDRILWAMRADVIPPAARGLWEVRRTWLRHGARKGDVSVPAGAYTTLLRATAATLHRDGECVMVDHVQELRKHIEFVLRARGRVLVTGLGLGCVVRGLLAYGRAESIDVVEKSGEVLDLVGPYIPRKVELWHADALAFDRQGPWDFAWHDLWTDEKGGEPALHVVHADLLARYKTRVRRWQGAWAFPRYCRRLWEMPIR